MLGASVAAAETPPPQQQAKPVPPKADTWDGVNKEIDTNASKTDQALVKVVAAVKAKKDVDKTTAAVADLRKARTALDDRLGKTTRPTPINEAAMPDVEKAETALTEADTKLWAAYDTAIAAKEDPDIKTAAAELDKSRKARSAAWSKVKTARSKSMKRPRAPEKERPVGRGFILA